MSDTRPPAAESASSKGSGNGSDPDNTGGSLRRRLADARLYLCTDARGSAAELERFLDAVLPAGVDIVQLRDKTLDALDELAALEVVARAARRHGRLWAVNDRADIAATVGADVLHLGQRDLPVPAARAVVGPNMLIGRSNNTPEMVDGAATEEGVDYFCCGPCWATPTKPGRPAAGLDIVRHTAQSAPGRPWFAIGGIDRDNLDEVLDAGATRIVVVRAITEATDLVAATADFASRLRGQRG